MATRRYFLCQIAQLPSPFRSALIYNFTGSKDATINSLSHLLQIMNKDPNQILLNTVETVATSTKFMTQMGTVTSLNEINNDYYMVRFDGPNADTTELVSIPVRECLCIDISNAGNIRILNSPTFMPKEEPNNLMEESIYEMAEEEKPNVCLTKATVKIGTQLKIPSFKKGYDDAFEALDKLDAIKMMHSLDDSTLISCFLQESDMTDLLLSLSKAELSDLTAFRQQFLLRYGDSQSSAAVRFATLTQKGTEDETTFLNRIQRTFNLLRGQPSNAALGLGDKQIVRERFLAGLKDSRIRLKLREENVLFHNLVNRARELRKAKESEDQASSSDLTAVVASLTARIDKMSAQLSSCNWCGRGHDSSQCRANAKAKAEYNKVKQGQRKPQNYVSFNTNQNSNDFSWNERSDMYYHNSNNNQNSYRGQNRNAQFQGNYYRGNNHRGNNYRGNNYRGNNYRGNNHRGNNFRGNNFRGNNSNNRNNFFHSNDNQCNFLNFDDAQDFIFTAPESDQC